jgi:hypothetical protein
VISSRSCTRRLLPTVLTVFSAPCEPRCFSPEISESADRCRYSLILSRFRIAENSRLISRRKFLTDRGDGSSSRAKNLQLEFNVSRSLRTIVVGRRTSHRLSAVRGLFRRTSERRTAPESGLTGPPSAMQRRHRDDSRWAFPLAAPHSDIFSQEALASRPRKAELHVEIRGRIGCCQAGHPVCHRVRGIMIGTVKS